MITAVVVEKRPVREVAVDYGVSRSWIYELLARYRNEGDAAFEPRSLVVVPTEDGTRRRIRLRADHPAEK